VTSKASLTPLKDLSTSDDARVFQSQVEIQTRSVQSAASTYDNSKEKYAIRGDQGGGNRSIFIYEVQKDVAAATICKSGAKAERYQAGGSARAGGESRALGSAVSTYL